MEKRHETAEFLNFLSTREMGDFHRKGRKIREVGVLHRESTHIEQKMWRKGLSLAPLRKGSCQP